MDNLSPHLSKVAVNLFIVTDSRGNIVYQAPSSVGGGDIYRTWGLEEALSGEEILSSGYGPQGWAIRSLAPLFQDGRQYGVLILGIYLNDDFARLIAEATHTNISFSTPYKVLASSWPPGERGKIGLPWVTRTIHEKNSFFHIDHQSNTSSFHVPIDIGDETVCLVVNTDTTPIYNLLQEKKRHLLTFFLGVLILILVIGAGLTLHIVSPLRALQQRALGMVQEISPEEIPVTRWGNEIQTLSQTMDLMLATIRGHLAELNQTQKTLRERENFLASVFASIQDGIVVMDRDYTILRANLSEEHQFRHDLPMVGRKCYELRHGFSQPCEECPCRQAMETGKTGYQLKEIKRGELKGWVETFAYPLQDLASGQVTGVIEYIRDVTERKQVKDDLARKNVEFEAIFNAISDGAVFVDTRRRVIMANPAFLAMFGWSLEEIIGQTTEFLYPSKAEYEELGKSRYHVGAQTQQTIFERQYRRKDGSRVTCETLGTQVKDKQGETIGFLAIHRDITARKEAEEALREARRDWEEIFQAIGQPAFLLDPEQRIIAANRSAFTALGGQAEEILGRKCFQLLHGGSDQPAFGCPMEKLLKSGQMETMEMEVEALEGYYLVSCTPVYDDQGKMQKVIHIATDITARKQAEEALSKSHRELQETAQQLEQSMNMLQLILESIPVRVFWKDKDSRYLGCNSLFAGDAGLSRPEELLGQDDFAMGWKEQAELYRADDRLVMESGLPKLNIIEPQTTPEGGNIWLNTSKVPLRTPNGEIFGVLGVYEDITARMRAEEALAEEAIRRRILVEQSRDGILVLDETGKVYEANQRYAEMLGYSSEEVRHLHVWDWDAQWNRAELLEMLRTVDETGYHFETRHRRRDGAIFDVEISTNGVLLGGQKLIFCVCRDISQRKAAEQALRESEEKYRLLVNQIPAVVFRGYEDWSLDTFDARKIEQLTGYPKEDFDTRRLKWIDLILEEDLSQVKLKFITALKNSGTYEREYRIRKKSGEIIWVQVQGRIFLDSAGRIDYISGVIFDITARKRAEDALLKYEFIANTATDCMTLIDRDYRYEAANAAYCRAHGRTWDEVVGRSVAEIWGEETFARNIKEYLDRCFSGQAVDFEGWFEFGRKGRGCYHVSYNPYYDEKGTVAHVAVVSHDITERKRVEQELRKERDLSISIMESLPGIFYLYDEQGRLTRWNKNLEAVSQYSAQEIAGMHPQDFFPDYDKPHAREAVQTCFATGEVRLEADLLSKKGAKLPYVLTGRRIIIDGQPLLVGMGLDISERRQMEEALKKRLVALSKPLDDAGDINFDDLFNLDDIQRIQDLFAEVTGVASLITTPEGAPLTRPSNFCRLCGEIVRQTEIGSKKCQESDASMGRLCHDGPNVLHCLSAGLCNAGASITVGGKHIANWMIGQVRDKTEDEEVLRSYARELGADENEFMAAFLEVPIMSEEKFKKVAEALFVLANQLSAMAYQNVQQARFITERQRAEEALRESEQRFRDIADSAREWIWELDAEGRFVYSSSTVEKLLGYTPEEIMNEYFYDFFHPEDKEEKKKSALAKYFAKIPPRDFIHRVIHKNGRTVWLQSTGVILLDDQGNVKGLRGAHTDITERLQAEMALKESESFLASVFASIQDSITILDKDLNILRVNPARERASAHEMPLVGKKCYETLYHASQPCEDCTALSTMRTGGPNQKIVTIELADREGLRHMNVSTFPLIDASGQITGVVEVGRDITEQKQAEEAIRERERMLSLVINAVPQVIFWKDLNSVYLGCNRNYARAAGLETPEAVVGKTEYDLPWKQQEIEIFLAEDREVMQTRQAKYHMVESKKLADGRQIWVDGTKIPLLTEDGAVMGLLGVYDDITERKKMEEDLLESETSYRTLAQNLPGLVYRVYIREKYRMEFYNDALQSMTGYLPQDLYTGESCSLDKYILPEDMEKVREVIKQAIALNQVFEVEYRFRKKDGSIRHFAERGKPIPGEDDRVSHIDGVIWDITEAKQLEAAIQESERRFRGLVENVPMGILIVQDGQIVYQNPEQERLFGHLHIQNCHDFVNCGHPDDLPKVQQFCQGTLAHQPQGDITLRFLPLGSTPQEKRPIWVNCRATVSEYRGQKAMLITMADITHTKELEQLMRIREKMASLGQVAAGIAHEIRNPLSGINVFLDGIKENFQDPESTAMVHELIEAAQDTSNRIEAVIKRVLDFSRPAELKLAPTDVNLAVEIAIKLTTASLRKDNIKIDSSLAADLPPVIADLQLLEQTLLNIINNACEALRSTGKAGQIQVTTQKAKDGVLILVNDSGPGIPPEIRDRIFDPFFTTKAEGSGIGLSLCQRIIIDHGGTIEVSSSDLGGTQFIIHLPNK
ncbi:MAG: PAS domain S-box protein [Thermodesulfobacteriota bacterium]